VEGVERGIPRVELREQIVVGEERLSAAFGWLAGRH
jgi:hypothetical protein